MLNTLEIDGVKALISYDPEIEMFRGEFLGLNGGADFYAADVFSLKKEGAISLRVYREARAE
jgi:predicted HicB family RNase H-like nuclease